MTNSIHNMHEHAIRIGIDVGGTFTHAVAIEAGSGEVVAAVCVPTSHRAERGVAEGVALALGQVLEESGADPRSVALVSHSTTQATNALLEGDVATVGVLAASVGRTGAGRITASRAKAEADCGDVPLDSASAKHVPVRFAWMESDDAGFEAEAAEALRELAGRGAEVIVAAEAFSIDDPTNERRIGDLARAQGLMATATSDISFLHGLRQRTRTAVVNASILPRMSEAAHSTARATDSLGVTAPLMIVRSDGGMMSASEAERRPLLTILSGPAAGVAAALRHVRIADGVFIEVGGTSTDITVIVDGKPTVEIATTGGHRLYLRTLAVHTLGVAGGSMPRLMPDGLSVIGPRSAHIAGLPYYGYALPQPPLTAVLTRPVAGDPDDYVVLEDGQGRRFAFTLTCASRTLAGGIPDAGSEAIGRMVGLSGVDACRRIIKAAVSQVAPAIHRAAEERGLPQARISLIGGGGGAEALVPHLAQAMGLPHRICEHAPVISAIGAALAMVHESVERHVVSPSAADIAHMREEARDAAVRAGARQDSIEVAVEVESATGILRASATGAVTMERGVGEGGEALGEEALAAKAAEILAREGGAAVERAGEAGPFVAFAATAETRAVLGLIRRRRRPCCVLDRTGSVRLQRADARVVHTQRSRVAEALAAEASYGDAGLEVPPARVFSGSRMIDVSTLVTLDQAQAMVEEELGGMTADAPALIVIG